MKRDFLEGLGLDKETVDKIMAENGAALEREKAKTAQAKTDLAAAQAQLGQRDKDLEALRGTAGDAEAVRKQLEELQASTPRRRSSTRPSWQSGTMPTPSPGPSPARG